MFHLNLSSKLLPAAVICCALLSFTACKKPATDVKEPTADQQQQDIVDQEETIAADEKSVSVEVQVSQYTGNPCTWPQGVPRPTCEQLNNPYSNFGLISTPEAPNHCVVGYVQLSEAKPDPNTSPLFNPLCEGIRNAASELHRNPQSPTAAELFYTDARKSPGFVEVDLNKYDLTQVTQSLNEEYSCYRFFAVRARTYRPMIVKAGTLQPYADHWNQTARFVTVADLSAGYVQIDNTLACALFFPLSWSNAQSPQGPTVLLQPVN